MNVIPTRLPEILIVEPTIHRDTRGFFVETYHARRYAASGIAATFVQDNHSRSARGTLRGLHWQLEVPQGKLVRVLAGEIFDVAVDVRPESPTFKEWVGVTMSAENFRQVYVPPGFAHGFCVISEMAEVEYKCTAFYAPEAERGLIWNDPDVAVAWPVTDPILSAKDQKNATLAELRQAHALPGL